MRVSINGLEQTVRSTTIAALLEELDHGASHVAVALNHDVVPRARWDQTTIKAGDEIEIITPRQGG